MTNKQDSRSSPTESDSREAANRRRRDFLDFLVKSSASAVALAATGSLAACGGGNPPVVAPPDPDAPVTPPAPAQFAFGVASGDPLADRVILWTHAKVPASDAEVALTWQVASDAGFARIVSQGRVSAGAAASFTAKVDATGLAAGATYFYRFLDATGASSSVGTTRTLPAADIASLKLAVFSCALYSEGYFHAYADAAASDAQYALHLGDYIYEYGSDPASYGNRDVPGNRVARPAHDTVSLNDYRTRYALYRSDLALQAAHARMPWIGVWDDHEFANDSHSAGARNHDPATQGDWITRKNIAARVYHEWMPIRPPDPADPLKIYRRFDFGQLLSLHMLDTRIEGRDRQYDSFGDADRGMARYLAGITPGADGVPADAARRMMSAQQQQWLTGGIQASTARWQFLGSQTVMARLWLPASVLTQVGHPAAGLEAAAAFLVARAAQASGAPLTVAQQALLSVRANPRLPFNLDAWDGYPAQREAILQAARQHGKRLVALSGDSHNGWCSHLSSLAGDRIGVEFAGMSVTSTGIESIGLGPTASALDGSALGPAAVGAGLGLIDDLVYCDTIRRGYLLVTVSAAAVKAEYIFVSDVKQPRYTAAIGRTITVAATPAGMAAPVVA